MSLRHMTPDNSVLVVIDYQERLLKIMDEDVSKACMRNINMATRLFQRLGAKVLVTEQYVKGLGPTHEALLQHLDGVPTYEKMAFSCCGEPKFMEAIQAFKPRHIVLTGMEAHICVLHTALDLIERGFKVYIMVDAIQSSAKLKWKTAVSAMEQAGVVALPTESILFGLLGRCGGDNFKYLSQMLKEP